MMPLETLDCNECGGPLDVPEDVNFVRCAHCGSRLRIKRDSSAHYTEVMERIERSTLALKDEVKSLRLQNELRALDDAWRVKRESLMVRGQDGHVSKPSIAAGVATGLIGVVGGGLWIAVTSSMMSSRSPSPRFSGPGFPGGGFPGGPPMNTGPGFELAGIFPLFGVVFVLVALVMAAYLIARAKDYERAEAGYLAQRRTLEEQMGKAQTN